MRYNSVSICWLVFAFYSCNGQQMTTFPKPVITIYKHTKNGIEFMEVQKPTQDGTEQTVNFVEGESLHMKCGIPDSANNKNYEYTWHRRLNTTDQSDREELLQEVGLLDLGNIRSRGSSLKLNMLYNTDTGSYKCIVTKYDRTINYCSVFVSVESIENVNETILDKNNFRELGMQELTSDRIKRFFYEINSPLKILQSTVIVREYKEDQILSCSDSVDFDEFNATWYKYKNNSILQIESKFNLILQKLKEEDEGIYFCTLHVNVTLLDSLPFPTYRLRLISSRTNLQNPTILYGPDSRMAYIEEATVFSCGITIENKTLNETKLYWLFFRTPQHSINDPDLVNEKYSQRRFISTYENGLHYYPKQNSSGVGILFVTNVTEADEGFYVCVVPNGNQLLIRNAFLKVKTFKSDPYGRNFKNFSAPVNGTVSFSFLVEIYTSRAVLKRLGSNILEENGQIIDTKNLTTGNLSFSIPDLTKKNQGWYLIEVTMKDFGKNKIVSYLEVFGDEYNEKETSGTELTISIIIIILIVIILILTTLVISLLLYAYHLIKNQDRKRSEIYVPWIKKIIIEKKVPIDSHDYMQDPLEMPVVKIERQRAEGNRMKSLMTSEYDIPLDDAWEFTRSKLRLGKCLGQGAFGKVVQAQAKGIIEENVYTTVAIKMLKVGHNDSDVINLISEMEIMKITGKHENIVNLLGCCTQTGNLLVIMEYASEGNLRDFLRKRRSLSGYENPNTGKFHSEGSISEKTQICFASQVAQGMEYLTSRQCVHRDLAARNVLVCDNNVAKIADFGLARDICNYDYYRKESDGRIPVKWMAPEALFHGVYTSQSDVWSYGVLLWEIMTFGGSPYPSMPNIEKLLDLLKSGYRMEKPVHCTDEIYKIMDNCWKNDPNDRPTFSDLVLKLQDYLMNNFPESIEYLEIQ